MLLTSLGLTVLQAAIVYGVLAASVAYSVQQAKKMRKAAKDAAEARKGFEVVTAGDTQPIPIVYGRAKVGGTRVWHNTKSSHIAPPTSNADRIFDAGSPAKTGYKVTWYVGEEAIETVIGAEPSSSLANSHDGSKNEFLYYEQVLCHGPISKVVDLVIDESRFLNDPEFAKKDSNAAFRTELHYDGSVANNMISYNFSDRTSAKFPGLAYAATAIRLNRDDPQFSGQVPSVQYFIEGRKVRKVNRSGVSGSYTYSLNSNREYSNNPAWCLLDYLIDANRFSNSNKLFDSGKALSLEDINLESFYNASLICDTIVLSNKPVYGNIWKSTDSTTNILSRNIRLYECNAIIDVEKPIRENIEALLSTMGDARLVWSGGQYKLSLQYPSSNANIQLAATLTDDDLVLGKEIQITWPSSSDRLNFATVKFHNESENFKEDSVSWPPKATGTFYRGLGGVRYPTTDCSGSGGILASYAVWSGSANTTTMTWKFRAVVSGVYTVKLQIDDSGNLTIFDDSTSAQIFGIGTSGHKHVASGTIALEANKIYTISISGTDTGGAKGVASTISKDNFIYWTTKEPAYTGYEVVTQTADVYNAMKAEDNGLELETSVFLEGCVDYYHALAKAEELVRTSRSASVIKFSYIVKNNFLEPGDIIKLDTSYLPTGTDLYVRVNEVSLNENAVCDISGTRFDYTQLAWNVIDSDYAKPIELFNFEVPVPSVLVFTPSEEILKNSSGKLSWDPVQFDGFANYIIYMATVNDIDANGKIVFNELGRTQANYYYLPPIKDKSAVFGIRTISKSNRLSQMTTTGDIAVLLRSAAVPPNLTSVLAEADSNEAKIKLSWTIPALRADGSSYDDHLGAVVYRSVDVNAFENATYIGESFVDSFYDSNEVYGNVYYWVKLLTTFGKSSEYIPSNSVEFNHFDSLADTRTPKPPTNLTTIINNSLIILNWVNPTVWPDLSEYKAHKSTLIYAAQKKTSVAPVFADAVLIDSSSYPSYSFVASPGETWYFWLKEITVSDIVSSPVGPISGTTVVNVEATLAALENQLDESSLTQTLRDRIDLIDNPASGILSQLNTLNDVYGSTVSAAQSAANAATSASQAATSLANTVISNAGVNAARDAAILARAEAQTANSSAQLSAAGAAQSATDASNSAASSEASAGLAATSEFNAASSANSASISAQEALAFSNSAQDSATSSNNSSISASASKDLAATSASTAVTSAASASASATNASQSAISADASKVIAITKAGEALISAENAASSEYNAAQSSLTASSFKDLTVTSALEALNSASAASTYADNASISMTAAIDSADAASVSKVAAQAARDSAISSANAAATSASNASAASTDASSSASSANMSAVSANTSANDAQTYAIQAASSASLAETATQAASDYANASLIEASNANTYAANALVYSQQSAISASSATGSAQSAASYLNEIRSTAVGFYSYANWGFDNDTDGWTATNATLSWVTGVLRISPSAADVQIRSPRISLEGKYATLVKAKVKRTAGSGWDGTLYYTTAGHGESATYKVVAEDSTSTGQYTIVEWDLSGVSDWTSNQISQIRLDLGSTTSDTFDIDWIAIGTTRPPTVLSGNINLANADWWKVGATLPTGWAYNGVAAEHTFVIDSDYTNRSTVILKATAANADTADGGFTGGDLITAIDRTKTYRFIIPVKLVTTASNIKWRISGVNTLNTSTANTTAYFVNATVPADKWYLAVGYVFPEASTGNTSNNAGLYDPGTGDLVVAGTNFCWNATADINYAILRDGVADGVIAYFGKPMIHLIDGSEPQIESMWFTAQSMSASVQSLATTVAGPDGATAQYTLKVDANGNLAGFGLSSTANEAGVGTSEFTILADKFSIAPVASTNAAWSSTTTYAVGAMVKYNAKNYKSLQASNLNKNPETQPTWWQKTGSPFFYISSQQTIDGRLLPAGLYLDAAYITKLQASQINTNGLTINDANGNPILQAGTAIDWTKLGGASSNLTGLGYVGDLDATNGADATNLNVYFNTNNLLKNSSFEAYPEVGDKIAVSWQAFSSTGTDPLNYSISPRLLNSNGTTSQKISSTCLTSSANYLGIKQTGILGTIAGKDVTFSFSAAGTAGTFEFGIESVSTTSVVTTIASSTSSNISTTAAIYELKATIPATCRYLQVYIRRPIVEYYTSIIGITTTNNVATMQLSGTPSPALYVGETIEITNLGAYDGRKVITSVNGRIVTFAQPNTAASAPGGKMYRLSYVYINIDDAQLVQSDIPIPYATSLYDKVGVDNKINTGNIDVYISRTAISAAYIAKATITSAEIATLDADTITTGTLRAGIVDITRVSGATKTGTTAGTFNFTIPDAETNGGTMNLRYTIVGAGGGGSGAGISDDSCGGNGGGGGGYVVNTIQFTAPAGSKTFSKTIRAVLGSGGLGGGVKGAGAAGGSSSIYVIDGASQTLLSTAGGGGGAGTGNYNGPDAGNPGAAGSPNGQAGTQGQESYNNGESSLIGGNGGASPKAVGGSVAYGNTYAGATGYAGGGGAGGGYTAGDNIYGGGKGGDGYVLLEFYSPNSIVTAMQYNTLLSALQRQNIAIV